MITFVVQLPEGSVTVLAEYDGPRLGGQDA